MSTPNLNPTQHQFRTIHTHHTNIRNHSSTGKRKCRTTTTETPHSPPPSTNPTSPARPKATIPTGPHTVTGLTISTMQRILFQKKGTYTIYAVSRGTNIGLLCRPSSPLPPTGVSSTNPAAERGSLASRLWRLSRVLAHHRGDTISPRSDD